jgi:diguanylate cyclase (GGDEF)-like protein
VDPSLFGPPAISGELGTARDREPQTRDELEAWIHHRLRLPAELDRSLLAAIEAVFAHHERLWRESKEEAIRALTQGFIEKMARVKHELSEKDATVSSISRYFERLVAELTERSNRDPKTQLMNFGWFTEQLESFLTLERRGRWCAVGLADINNFKWYNDAFGHVLGDRIIERVAQVLREQVRSDDLLARKRQGPPPQDLHARFGGDEFCFLVPDVANCQQAYAVAERFRESVTRYDWTIEDARLQRHPVRVDVGLICLALGPVANRRIIARRVAAELITRADILMYEAKSEPAGRIHMRRVRIDHGVLTELADTETSFVGKAGSDE